MNCLIEWFELIRIYTGSLKERAKDTIPNLAKSVRGRCFSYHYDDYVTNSAFFL